MSSGNTVLILFGAGALFALITSILISAAISVSNKEEKKKTYSNLNIAFGVFACLTVVSSGIATAMNDK